MSGIIPPSIMGALTTIYRWTTSNSQTRYHVSKEIEFKATSTEDNDWLLVDQANEIDIPIYCIHGTLDRPGSMAGLAENLALNLPGEVTQIHIPSFLKRFQGTDIKTYSEQLLKTILDNKHKIVILIGYSRGGLVASYVAEEAAKHGITVVCVVTICTPFKGARGARLGGYALTALQEMAPNSSFLTNLDTHISSSSIPYHAITAAEDWIVSPKDAAPSQAATITQLSKEGHMSSVASKELPNIVINIIKTAIQNFKEKKPGEDKPSVPPIPSNHLKSGL